MVDRGSKNLGKAAAKISVVSSEVATKISFQNSALFLDKAAIGFVANLVTAKEREGGVS